MPGFAQEQQVRLRALPLADGTVRPVYEANVVDAEKGSAFAYTLMVDAVTGDVLHRQNQAESSNDAFPFQGEITATECGPDHEFELTDGNTRQIVAVAAMANSLDDAVVKIIDPDGQVHRLRRPGHQPRDRDVHRRLDPGGHLRAPRLPVRRADRAVHPARQLRRRRDHERLGAARAR